MKKLISKFEVAVIGWLKLQPIFESLHRFALRGMNYEQSHVLDRSGELFVLNHLLSLSHGEDHKHVFDVGANNGQYLSHLSEIFPSNFSIFSFEPTKQAFENLKSKDWDKNVKLFNHGFFSEDKELELINPGSTVGSIYPTMSQESNSEIIKVKTLDNFCFENEIDEIYFLKVDVEGAEFDVLKGATKLIENSQISFIQFEFGGNNSISKVFLKDFFDLLSDYNIYRVVRNGLRKVNYHASHEIFLNANFLAKHKRFSE